MRVLLTDGSGLTARQTASQRADAGHVVEVLSPDYRDSIEELTPARGDPRAAIPLAVAVLAVTARPSAWRWFSAGSSLDPPQCLKRHDPWRLARGPLHREVRAIAHRVQRLQGAAEGFAAWRALTVDGREPELGHSDKLTVPFLTAYSASISGSPVLFIAMVRSTARYARSRNVPKVRPVAAMTCSRQSSH